jgi:hypothetical protein
MISLNGVTLHNELLWEGEFDDPLISQNIQRTIKGSLIVQNLSVAEEGRIINLTARLSGSSVFGYFTKTQVKGFKLLEKTGATVVFIYESTQLNVIVKAGGVNMRPLIPRPNQQDTDLYTGVLTLIEIG